MAFEIQISTRAVVQRVTNDQYGCQVALGDMEDPYRPTLRVKMPHAVKWQEGEIYDLDMSGVLQVRKTKEGKPFQVLEIQEFKAKALVMAFTPVSVTSSDNGKEVK